VGDNISPKFDSMMGKLIITAQSRETAVARVRRALKELCIEGVPTPAKLFEQIFNDPEFTAENHSFDVSTKWMERKYLNRVPAASLGGQPASLVSGKSADESENKQPAMESFIIEVDNKRVKLTIPQDIVDNLTGSARVRSVSRASQPLRGRSLRGSTRKSEEQKQIPGVIA
ncbi:carboxylate--amine ligase, partial [Bifidobacteriaceae bacterium NR015]